MPSNVFPTTKTNTNHTRGVALALFYYAFDNYQKVQYFVIFCIVNIGLSNLHVTAMFILFLIVFISAQPLAARITINVCVTLPVTLFKTCTGFPRILERHGMS